MFNWAQILGISSKQRITMNMLRACHAGGVVIKMPIRAQTSKPVKPYGTKKLKLARHCLYYL